MGLFRKKENRAQDEVQAEEALLQALLQTVAVTKKTALQVPTVSGGIDLIAGVIAGTPIKLYQEQDGKAIEVKDDIRLKLLNDETGDTLNANQFWRAMVQDYYLGKGAYAYIHKEAGRYQSIHYVDEEQICIVEGTDPIFKNYNIQVNGTLYFPFQFLKILRNTKNGATGTPITEENEKLIETAYQSMCFEAYLVRKGGNKKGFLKSEKQLGDPEMTKLKEAFRKLYTNDSDNVVVLNKGIDFKESSSTSVEMQLNEHKVTNAGEFAKLFHISTEIMAGKADQKSVESLAKLAAIPLMVAIQCALNRDFLLEAEKEKKYYWAFDTKQLLKGSMKERFEAYKVALEANFMQPDEVRFEEDLPPLGLKWIKLGLQDVLYDPETGEIYTPNTNQTAVMGKNTLHIAPANAKMESRANPNHDPKNGRCTHGDGAPKWDGKSKYSPSKQRNTAGIKLGKKQYARLCGTLGTLYPGLKAGERRVIRDNKKKYVVEADGYGGFKTLKVAKIQKGE